MTEGGPDGLHLVLDHAHLDASDELARHRHGLVTGLSMLTVSPEVGAVEQLTAMVGSAPAEMRVEIVLCDPPRSTTERLDMLAWPWHAVPAGPDRASTLDTATAASTGEFLVVGSEPAGHGHPGSVPAGESSPAFDRLAEALGLMWVNGADAMVVDRTLVDVSTPEVDAPGGDRRAELLADVLGLRRGPVVGLVILRRWVARFLFEELGRAIDPCHELAERIRLLELRLIEVRQLR